MNGYCGSRFTYYVDTQALSRTFVAFVERATTTTSTTTTTTIPQCDSSSYTTCSNAYTFTTSGSKSNMCGIEQYYKISTPQGKKCDIEWKLIPDSPSDYDLYVKWDSNCPSTTEYDCRPYLGSGVTEICTKREFSGATYALVKKFGGIGVYKIEVSITNCVDITTTTTTSTTTTIPYSGVIEGLTASPNPARARETVTLSFVVKNTGTQRTTYKLVGKVEGSCVNQQGQRDITLNPGESQTINV